MSDNEPPDDDDWKKGKAPPSPSNDHNPPGFGSSGPRTTDNRPPRASKEEIEYRVREENQQLKDRQFAEKLGLTSALSHIRIENKQALTRDLEKTREMKDLETKRILDLQKEGSEQEAMLARENLDQIKEREIDAAKALAHEIPSREESHGIETLTQQQSHAAEESQMLADIDKMRETGQLPQVQHGKPVEVIGSHSPNEIAAWSIVERSEMVEGHRLNQEDLSREKEAAEKELIAKQGAETRDLAHTHDIEKRSLDADYLAGNEEGDLDQERQMLAADHNEEKETVSFQQDEASSALHTDFETQETQLEASYEAEQAAFEERYSEAAYSASIPSNEISAPDNTPSQGNYNGGNER